MDRRSELQALLETLLGSKNVYFQPPASIQMQYPAIVYSRTSIENVHANDGIYGQNDIYEVIVIERNPESSVVRALSKVNKCRHTRHFVSDNLYHDVFRIYF